VSSEEKTSVCPNCGVEVKADEKFCPSCGQPVPPKEAENSTEQEQGTSDKIFCEQCGRELAPGQSFCPYCGHKVGEKVVQNTTDDGGAQQPPAKPEKKKKKVVTAIIGIIIAVVVVTALIIVVRGPQPKEIVLNQDTASVKVGDNTTLKFTINPDNTKNKDVTWKSSNDTIATVSNGNITGKNEGKCTITVETANGKTDTCEVTVEKAGPDFIALYNQYCDSSYATVASDGSYLSIDTNPSDIDDYTDSDALEAIMNVNTALGLPDSVMEKIGNTRAMDGMQTAEGDGVEISWTYHPDNGLEVIYSLTD